jgi:hypothetical protein
MCIRDRYEAVEISSIAMVEILQVSASAQRKGGGWATG